LARPSGNITGVSLQNLDLANKRFELLREVVPRIRLHCGEFLLPKI